MDKIQITRKTVQLPPIEKIMFTSEYGTDCSIRKENDYFSCNFSKSNFLLDRGTVKELAQCLQAMVDGM